MVRLSNGGVILIHVILNIFTIVLKHLIEVVDLCFFREACQQGTVFGCVVLVAEFTFGVLDSALICRAFPVGALRM